MSKGDRATIRTRDGALFSVVATKVGGNVDAILDAENEEDGGIVWRTIRELTRSGEVLRSVEVDDAEVQAVILDRDGDPTLGGTRKDRK